MISVPVWFFKSFHTFASQHLFLPILSSSVLQHHRDLTQFHPDKIKRCDQRVVVFSLNKSHRTLSQFYVNSELPPLHFVYSYGGTLHTINTIATRGQVTFDCFALFTGPPIVDCCCGYASECTTQAGEIANGGGLYINIIFRNGWHVFIAGKIEILGGCRCGRWCVLVLCEGVVRVVCQENGENCVCLRLNFRSTPPWCPSKYCSVVVRVTTYVIASWMCLRWPPRGALES